MGILALAADERVADVLFNEDELSVRLMDGRTISAPLAWYPRLLHATESQRKNWQISGGGYGIRWEDIDEDLSTEGLLRGAPAPMPVLAASKPTSRQREESFNSVTGGGEAASTDEEEKGILDQITERE
jgi:hypothetical protein